MNPAADALVMRWSTAADCDALMAFNSRIHFFVPEHESSIPAMTRDLLSGGFPGFRPDQFSLVVQKDSGKIVSAMALIPQTWTYGGIPFPVGRPELVGTDPAYRGRGLIRRQFQLAHSFFQERGCLAGAITGIPFFYRQFDYELGLASDGGLAADLPLAPLPGAEHFQIFPAQPVDLGWIAEGYRAGSQRYLLSCPRDARLWQYEVFEKSDTNIHKSEVSVIATTAGQPAGFFICPKNFGPVTEKAAFCCELLPGFDWPAVLPAVLQYLAQQGAQEAAQKGGDCRQVGLRLGESHPAYAAARPWLTAALEPGVWYVRVPDLPAFLRRVSPVLQKRLSAAPEWAQFTGSLKISLYTQAFRITIREGVIEQIAPYALETWEDADAAFPYFSFLQLVFGYRTLNELRYAYADCWCHPNRRGLLETLFPRLPSAVWGIA